MSESPVLFESLTQPVADTGRPAPTRETPAGSAGTAWGIERPAIAKQARPVLVKPLANVPQPLPLGLIPRRPIPVASRASTRSRWSGASGAL